MSNRLEERLIGLMQSTPWFMGVLQAVQACEPPDWLVGGGVIRNLLWDHLHDRITPTPLRDVDVAYFDPHRVDETQDQQVEDCLRATLPEVPWQAKNQAAVHLWYERAFGFPEEPLDSSADGVGTWPETATSVAVRLLHCGELVVVAPCGLADLFSGILRRNPRRVTREIFERRCSEKRILETWPQVLVMMDWGCSERSMRYAAG